MPPPMQPWSGRQSSTYGAICFTARSRMLSNNLKSGSEFRGVGSRGFRDCLFRVLSILSDGVISGLGLLGVYRATNVGIIHLFGNAGAGVGAGEFFNEVEAEVN